MTPHQTKLLRPLRAALKAAGYDLRTAKNGSWVFLYAQYRGSIKKGIGAITPEAELRIYLNRLVGTHLNNVLLPFWVDDAKARIAKAAGVDPGAVEVQIGSGELRCGIGDRTYRQAYDAGMSTVDDALAGLVEKLQPS